MSMQIPDHKTQNENLDGSNTTVPVKKRLTQFSKDAETIVRQDAYIQSLHQNNQFLRDMLVKQQASIAQQQDFADKQLALLDRSFAPIVPPSMPVSLSSAPEPSSLKIISHPLGANLLSAFLSPIPLLLGAWVSRYWRHSPDKFTSTLFMISVALSIFALATTLYFAVLKKKMPALPEHLTPLAIGVSCLCFLGIIAHTLWQGFASLRHENYFWLVFGVVVGIVVSVNLGFSTLSVALWPGVRWVKKRFSQEQVKQSSQ
jgi:hypothetical protein